MGLDYIKFDNGHHVEFWPSWQSIGGASRWIMPLAQHVLRDHKNGLDIGYSKECWMFPGAIGIEPSIDNSYHAMYLPNASDAKGWDYIFSSHCLEHVKENWMNVLDYWLSKIRLGGILFLYLPHASQTYWLPEHNRKHVHSFTGEEIARYLMKKHHEVYYSGPDYNNSFVLICEKRHK